MDSLIFDLDGTLWDATEAFYICWNEVFSKYEETKQGMTLKEIKSVMGMTMEDILEKFFPTLNDKTRKELIDECTRIELKYLLKKGGKLYPELQNTIKELSKKYKLFIVSNCVNGYIQCFLETHNLKEYFKDFEDPSRTGLEKAKNIRIVMERNRLSNSAYVGDTKWDKVASEKAGIPFIYASYGFGDVDKYDYKINNFKELLNINNTKY
ncbi:HAD family hydrolase [Clostridium taeniosporum]|uniref:HAD family hydrolase n=1 Tax=Clostridium taeniosporum TaxID=394958 RepID=A0A1D7XM11_9CLOT|nr:HAD family hydrolase [Clostridium taeniosporum]AOR24403.1 HAD family hydrolase [Clostridium taeniosporum]